jgi:hypothetical protein
LIGGFIRRNCFRPNLSADFSSWEEKVKWVEGAADGPRRKVPKGRWKYKKGSILVRDPENVGPDRSVLFPDLPTADWKTVTGAVEEPDHFVFIHHTQKESDWNTDPMRDEAAKTEHGHPKAQPVCVG